MAGPSRRHRQPRRRAARRRRGAACAEAAVIGKVMRGCGVGGLLRYLFGPGRCNEHVGPHLVAAWDDDPAALEPGWLADGRRDLRRLSGLLEQPLAVAVRSLAKTVWHCAVRTAPTDRRLSD